MLARRVSTFNVGNNNCCRPTNNSQCQQLFPYAKTSCQCSICLFVSKIVFVLYLLLAADKLSWSNRMILANKRDLRSIKLWLISLSPKRFHYSYKWDMEKHRACCYGHVCLSFACCCCCCHYIKGGNKPNICLLLSNPFWRQSIQIGRTTRMPKWKLL